MCRPLDPTLGFGTLMFISGHSLWLKFVKNDIFSLKLYMSTLYGTLLCKFAIPIGVKILHVPYDIGIFNGRSGPSLRDNVTVQVFKDFRYRAEMVTVYI